MINMGEFLYLSVCALKTLYFSFLRVVMVCCLVLMGNKSLNFPSAKLCLANLKVSMLRLFFKVSRFKVLKASLYDLYFSSKTSLQKVFCVLSRSSSFSAVSPLLQTAQDCSKMHKQYVFHKVTISSKEEPKLQTFRRSCILALTFLIILVQFSFQDNVLEITVPRILIWSTVSIFWLFNFNLV